MFVWSLVAGGFLTWSASDVLSMLISSLSAVSLHICSQPIRRSLSKYSRMTPARKHDRVTNSELQVLFA